MVLVDCVDHTVNLPGSSHVQAVLVVDALGVYRGDYSCSLFRDMLRRLPWVLPDRNTPLKIRCPSFCWIETSYRRFGCDADPASLLIHCPEHYMIKLVFG